jgi:hypothetical protein
MSTGFPKLVDSNHYHLWTDALHARQLSHQTKNKWDRGSYVRWTIITAWIVLEMSCQDALEEPNISYSFRQNLDDAVANKGFHALDWSKGIWQSVTQLLALRKNCVHRFIYEINVFPETQIADGCIHTVREAIKDIYDHVNKKYPVWIDDDEDRGWDRLGLSDTANLTLIKAGVNKDDLRAIKIALVMQGKEHISDIYPPGTNPAPIVEDIIGNLSVPINAIRVYEGDTLILERELRMRGA